MFQQLFAKQGNTTMKIILRQDFESLGKIGDVVNVKDGYARNYLFPKKIAYVALPGQLRALEEEKKQIALRSKKELQFANKRAGDLKQISITIKMKVGDQDRLFGSVTSQDIANELKAKNFQVDKRSIELEEPIKSIGKFNVSIKLHSEVKGTVEVNVEKE